MSYCDEPEPKWALVALVIIILVACWCEYGSPDPVTPSHFRELNPRNYPKRPPVPTRADPPSSSYDVPVAHPGYSRELA